MVPIDNRRVFEVSPPPSCTFCVSTDRIYSVTDWFFFLVLDIGNPAIDSIPVGTRILLGLLQATAVRAAGFGTVALSALAPAVKCVWAFLTNLPG